LSGCQPTETPTPVLSLDQAAQVSLLVDLDSPVYIKREGWTSYQRTDFGALVYPTDLLKPERQITLLCADMRTIQTLAGLGRNPCPLFSDDQLLSYDEMKFSTGVRSAPKNSVPYILYPRSTSIQELNPILRWHNTDAATYTVEIWQGAKLVWQATDVTGDSVAYPKTAPKLQTNKDYLLIVTDNTTGEVSTTDPNKGLGFQTISIDQRAELETQQQQILSNLAVLDSTAQKLALGIYYSQNLFGGRGIWGEAQALLTEVIQSKPTAPAVQLRLGEVMGKMRLWTEAQAVYENALIQAQNLNDLESQAEALAALWRITQDQAQFDKAMNLLEQLGDKEKASILKSELTQ
jgi:hypothetical protein